MYREKNNSKNGKDGNNKDSNYISEEKQKLSDSNTVEDRQNAKHELIYSIIVEDSQNVKQELNDTNSVDDIKTTEKMRDEEKSCKRDIYK